MKVVQNTPDLLVLRYIPVGLTLYGVALTLLFLMIAIYALISGAIIEAFLLFGFVGVLIAACHKQQLKVGVYFDKTHDTVAIHERRILSNITAIHPLTDVQSATLEENGLAQRIALVLADGQNRPLTRDFFPRWYVRKAAQTMNEWISANR